ncbi:hypothetical protein ABPG77_009915 [Micractinium sp. CCAP 211/92]
MSRRLGVTLALVGLVLLAAHARADDLSERIEDEERDSERLPATAGPGKDAAADAAQAATAADEQGGWHHKKHEKHHHHLGKHHVKDGKHGKCHHGKHRRKHGWWHALEKRAEAFGEGLEDRAEKLVGDKGALAALGACLCISAGILAAWLLHRRRMQPTAAKRVAECNDDVEGLAKKGEQAPLLVEEQGKQA